MTVRSARKNILTELIQCFRVRGLPVHKEYAGSWWMPVNLAHCSYGCQDGSKFYSNVCWVAPIQSSVGLCAARWNDA